MRFKIHHKTKYSYQAPVFESVGEMRVCPLSNDAQQLKDRKLKIYPNAMVRAFHDFFGNCVECFSVPFRHDQLLVESECVVETSTLLPMPEQLGISLGEARQILKGHRMDPYLFSRPSRLVPMLLRKGINDLPKIKSQNELGEIIPKLNEWIYRSFRYWPGTTQIETPLEEVLKQRSGVCQDFAHVFLSISRSLGLPARYVSGYIEGREPGEQDDSFVGAMASHAWVEVMLPGGFWWGWDPTNNCAAGERHIKVAVGRDYSDVSPLRGTYRGSTSQKLDVEVYLERV
jgi:transglutaminase-like putative cysteine protease